MMVIIKYFHTFNNPCCTVHLLNMSNLLEPRTNGSGALLVFARQFKIAQQQPVQCMYEKHDVILMMMTPCCVEWWMSEAISTR